MDVREKSSNEKRLIDANKLIDFIDVGHLRHPGELCYSEVDVANLLLHAQTVDAAEVVRCLECKHMVQKSHTRSIYCTFWRAVNGMGIDGFCNYGERKEGADNEP